MSSTAYAGRTASARGAGLFGRVMALVAVTVGFATLGVFGNVVRLFLRLFGGSPGPAR